MNDEDIRCQGQRPTIKILQNYAASVTQSQCHQGGYAEVPPFLIQAKATQRGEKLSTPGNLVMRLITAEEALPSLLECCPLGHHWSTDILTQMQLALERLQVVLYSKPEAACRL